MTVKQRNSVAAFTLIEVMAAILIVTIVIAGGSFLFVMGKGQISLQKHYRAATQLAAQKLEELKDANYPDITAGVTEETIPLEGLSYTRSTLIEIGDVNSTYKRSTVTVSWGQAGNEHNVNMVTCIAP